MVYWSVQNNKSKWWSYFDRYTISQFYLGGCLEPNHELQDLCCLSWNGEHTAVAIILDSKVYGANMGPIWGWKSPGGPHVGPMNFPIWDIILQDVQSLPCSTYIGTQCNRAELKLLVT